jgi:hypothetical protein
MAAESARIHFAPGSEQNRSPTKNNELFHSDRSQRHLWIANKQFWGGIHGSASSTNLLDEDCLCPLLVT